MVGVFNVLAAVVRAQVRGDEFFVVMEEQLIGIDLKGELLGSVEVRHGVAVGLKNNPAATVGADGPYGPAVIGTERQGFEQGLFLGKPLAGFGAGFTVDAHVGYGVQPRSASRVERLKGGDFQAVEEVLFDVTHAVLHAPLFVGLPDLAGHGDKAVVGGEVQVTRWKRAGAPRGCSSTPTLRLSIMTLAGAPPKNSKAWRWQERNCSMPSERVNSTYMRRLWHRTLTKKLKRRLVEPTVTEPKLPQST